LADSPPKNPAPRANLEAVLQKEPPMNRPARSGGALRVTGAEPKEIEGPQERRRQQPQIGKSAIALVNFYLRHRNTKALDAAREAQAAAYRPAVNNALGTAQLAAGDSLQAVATSRIW
jgi:hypothetical protein